MIMNTIKDGLAKFGVQINRYPDHDLKRRMKIIDTNKINVLFDIGANSGQYGKSMRKLGYQHKMYSFEPVKEPFLELEKFAATDQNWETYNFAIGHENCKSIINVAGNSFSSSILDMLQNHEDSAPSAAYVAQQEIEIKTLDSIFNSMVNTGEDKVMLKIDTQGYEKNVIDGASESLDHIQIIQLEMSIVSLYAGELLYREMIDLLESKGFKLYSLENGFSDPNTGQLLQVDGVFVRE